MRENVTFRNAPAPAPQCGADRQAFSVGLAYAAGCCLRFSACTAFLGTGSPSLGGLPWQLSQ